MIENELRDYAKRVALNNPNHPHSSIVTYATKEKDVSYQATIEVRGGLFGITKKTEYVTKTRKQRITEEAHYDLSGWILETYYEKAYEVQKSDGELLTLEEWDYYYALGADGSLIVTTVFIETKGPAVAGGITTKETVKIETTSMSFDLPDKWGDGSTRLSTLIDKRSVFLLDYDIQEWRTSNSRDSCTINHIDRNYPFFLSGEGKTNGAATLRYSQGNGLLERLKAIGNNG